MRFAANDARRRNGMRVLSPAEYLSLESAYRRVLSANGLPAGFYDSPDDFRAWLEGDVDPTEIQARAKQAADWVANTDPSVRQAFQDFYGVGDSELVAYALDRKRGLSLLERTAQAVTIGAAGIRHGINVTAAEAEQYANQGKAQIADQALSAASEVLPEAQRLSAIHTGEDYGEQDAKDEFLGTTASARRKRRQLVEQEQALFSGSTGQTTQSLRSKSTAGSY